MWKCVFWGNILIRNFEQSNHGINCHQISVKARKWVRHSLNKKTAPHKVVSGIKFGNLLDLL